MIIIVIVTNSVFNSFWFEIIYILTQPTPSDNFKAGNVKINSIEVM